MTFDPADALQDIQYFGEFGGVNPSITDSSTYTFLKADRLEDVFEHEIEGCYLYSRHWNPMNRYLSDALASIESTEAASVTASGMSAIACTIMQLCGSGDHIVASRTIYGGTYALLKNFLPRFGITTSFVDSTNVALVKAAITNKTKLLFCEAMSNPLLEITDLPAMAQLAEKQSLQLIVDNTFTPLIFTPQRLGAHITVHSLTKFINGSSDCIAGAVCASKDFIGRLANVADGATMLLGPVMDSFRASSILKNLRDLHLRMKKHSDNAMFLAQNLREAGATVRYPGFIDHPQHNLMTQMMNRQYGYGGMMLLDAGDRKTAYQLMEMMQNEKVGYLAVSLGCYKTLFSCPGSSTSSEISEAEQASMGLSDGLIRMSIGLDNHIEKTFDKIARCMKQLDIIA